MKVYTFLTDSHRIFLDSYIRTFPFEDNFDLEIKFLPQECHTGKYHSDGWNKTMRRKVEYILYSLQNCDDNSLFVHSDVDVQFFGPIKTDLENLMEEKNHDILFQNDGHQMSMGFFVCKKNDKTIRLFKDVLQNLDNHRDDQFATNFFLKKSDLIYGPLPERY